MNKSAYIIGSGFSQDLRYNQITFAELWLQQVRKIAPLHVPIYVLEHDSYNCPWPNHGDTNARTIPVSNLGHVHQLIGQQKPLRPAGQELCGWSASVLLLAMLAYNCEKDLVYIEQDVLVFGDVIRLAYQDMENMDVDFAFGSCRVMGAAQSFFVLKWKRIPDFLRAYLALWPDTDPTKRPEGKFLHMEHLPWIGRYSFGVDRDRPLPWDAPVWYAQHWDPAELVEAKERGLL